MKSNGSTPERNKRPRSLFASLMIFPTPTLVRFLLFSISISSLSIPFILHFSLSGDCTDNSSGRQSFPSLQFLSKGGKVRPPRIRNARSVNYQAARNDASPPIVHTLEHPPPDSPYTIIHTILTRFMVGQASKHHLARARYLLFETFCWPTIWNQRQQNFYWLVLVDPGLDRSVITDMQSLLVQMPNAFMVLTNNTAWAADGIGVQNASSYGVGLRTVAEEFQKGTVEVVTGNTKYLQQALQYMSGQLPATNPKPILAIETLLDADDGMNNNAVEWIQTTAVQKTIEQQDHWKSSRSLFDFSKPATPHLNTTWWFLCGTDHIEWHNRDIFRISAEEYARSGLTGGLAGIRSKPTFCTSAGFTRIGLTQAPTTMTFPKDAYSNHALAFYFAPCTDAANHFAILQARNISVSQCWRREFPGRPFILKSRTIGSDSMDNMNPRDQSYRDVSWVNDTQIPLLINETEIAWEMLVQDFSVNRRDAWTTSLYFYEHRKQILQDNKDSRCSPGFPCYKAAKKNLVLLERLWMRQESGGNDQKDLIGSRRSKMHEIAFRKLQRQRTAQWEKLGNETNGTVHKE
ncbi:putative rhamnosyl transferase [Nitzschia inconspicua]|uniref:Rhamnosyl transferase n=1 Tax=Nitzschia inconspicua TaxID=303405 RepID=A0A9K3PTC9_9STRA|nr:putative rhamnosyl transferase [Nitzschia inconspicua]